MPKVHLRISFKIPCPFNFPKFHFKEFTYVNKKQEKKTAKGNVKLLSNQLVGIFKFEHQQGGGYFFFKKKYRNFK